MKVWKWIVLVLVIAVAAAIIFIMTSNSSTQVTVKDSAAESTAKDTDIEPGLRPAPGVYAAEGTGKESVTALGGSSHSFPAEVPMEVSLDADNECHFTQQIQFIEESVLTRDICITEDGVAELGYTTEVKFFGVTTTREFTCEDDSFWFTPDSEPDSVIEHVCTSGDDTELAVVATYLGEEPLMIGKENITAHHVRTDNTFSGGVEGKSIADFWFGDNGLILGYTADSTTTTTAVFGDTDYHVEYEYRLSSLDPE